MTSIRFITINLSLNESGIIIISYDENTYIILYFCNGKEIDTKCLPVHRIK